MPDITTWTSGLFIPNRRSIGGIHAQVTISEQERDELQITEHPVEQGAPISDHAFKRPSEVHIRAGWNCRSGDIGATSGNGMYALLLSWQAALNPFDLYTGKRIYKNMLIQSLTVTTDSHSEFTLMAEIVCRQVIIVRTTVQRSNTLTSANPNNQNNPESNASPVNNGQQQGRSVSPESNQSDLGGGGDTKLAPGEESLRGDEMGYLTDYGSSPAGPSGPTPEAAKIENTIQKNDPTGAVQSGKGLGDDFYLNDAPSPAGPKSVRTRVYRPNIISLAGYHAKSRRNPNSIRAAL